MSCKSCWVMFLGCFCLLFGQLHDMHDIHDFKTHNIPRCLGCAGTTNLPFWYDQSNHPLGHKIFGGGAVNAHDLLKKATDSDVVLYLDGETLRARGSRQAIENLSPELRAHKVEVVALLANTRMAANDPMQVVARATEPQDPDTWHELAKAYRIHHWSCHACIAAGRGTMYGQRCDVGLALFRTYQDAV